MRGDAPGCSSFGEQTRQLGATRRERYMHRPEHPVPFRRRELFRSAIQLGRVETGLPGTQRLARVIDNLHLEVDVLLRGEVRISDLSVASSAPLPSVDVPANLLSQEVDALKDRGFSRTIESDQAGELRQVEFELDERLEVVARDRFYSHRVSGLYGDHCLVPSCHRLDLSQQVAELAVIDLHAVVQVEGDLLVGVVTELLVVGV